MVAALSSLIDCAVYPCKVNALQTGACSLLDPLVCEIIRVSANAALGAVGSTASPSMRAAQRAQPHTGALMTPRWQSTHFAATAREMERKFKASSARPRKKENILSPRPNWPVYLKETARPPALRRSQIRVETAFTSCPPPDLVRGLSRASRLPAAAFGWPGQDRS